MQQSEKTKFNKYTIFYCILFNSLNRVYVTIIIKLGYHLPKIKRISLPFSHSLTTIAIYYTAQRFFIIQYNKMYYVKCTANGNSGINNIFKHLFSDAYKARQKSNIKW